MKNGAFAKLYTRLVSLLLALVLVAGFLPVQAAVGGAAEENSVVYNGSFDLSNTNTQTAPGWGLNPGSSNHTVTIQNGVAYGNTGYALKIEATGQSYVFTADFAVEAGATYMLSYYIRVDSAANLQYAPFMNDSNYSGGWWKDYVLAPVQGTTDGWKKVSGTVTIPESVGANAGNPQSKIQLGFKVYAGSGTFYLDQVSLVKVNVNLDDPNQCFEHVNSQSGAPLNWSTSAAGVMLASDSTVYHAGTRSMYIKKQSLEEKSAVDSTVHLPVTAGNVYEFSFWVCSQNADPTATVRLDLIPYAADGTRVQLEDGSAATVQGVVSALNGGTQRSGWTKVVTRSALPEGTAYVSFQLLLTRGSAEIWIDDIFFNIVENGTDCVVYYEDFHAVDEKKNISTWQHTGSGSFAADNGGKLTVSDGEGYIYTELTCLMTDYTYCLKGDYTANMGGTVQVRFYDYRKNEYTEERKTIALQAGGTSFAVNFTAPSHTYAAIYIGSDQTGTVTVSDVTVYMTAQPPKPNRNYLDADWTAGADRENVVSSVEIYNGIPTLMINGQPTAAYLYQRPDLNAYLQTDAESRIAESGLTLYVTYGGNLYKGGCDPIWLEDGSIDYAAFDAVIYDTLAANDDALVMVNIGMFAPKWWLKNNPDHQAQAYNGSQYIPLDDVSLTSDTFRQEAGQVLRQLIRHMKQQPYYSRVFGLKISGGQSYEWMHLGTGYDQGPDYSKVSQEGFKTYLQNKYKTVEALQEAWGNTTVTFETAAAPGWDARCASSNVYMGDADTGALSRNMVDWNLWLGEASADSFLYYCQIAKEETDDQIIVGGYNGYLWTSNTHDSQGKAHTAIDRVLDSEYVDWIASPIAYSERLIGQSSAYMALLDTVQAHGKLYIAEQDNRTCLSDSYAGVSWDANWDYKIGQARTMADTIYQQKRDYANALVNGAGLWQFDMYGGWLDDDQIYGYISDAKQEYDLSVHLDRNTTNEVAVFVGDETYAYLTAENGNMSFTLLEPMLMQQRKHLAAMGAGYDTYAMSSLLEGKVPPHKLNIILSPFEITEQMHTAMDTYLKTNGQVVVWVYLPGISTGKEMSLNNVERATGFSVGVVEKKSTLRVQLAQTQHSLTNGIAGLLYGNSVTNSVSPLAYIQDTTGATVLGYNVDGGAPGLAVKNMGDWTSVYSAAPCLDVQLLRNLMVFAGCHSYSDNPADIIYSGSSYVALHSAAAGEKTIHLPGNYSVYDVFSGKFVSMNTNTITYQHRANDTHIFRLMQPGTYTVTAVIQKGKGNLSAPGLTQTAAGQSYCLQITPELGYKIDTVTVNGKTVALDNGLLQIAAVNENTAIAVSFCKQIQPDNWGFEQGSFGDDVIGLRNATVVSDAAVHSGSYSLRLNHDGTARDLVGLTVHIQASTKDRVLTVSYWAKTATGGVGALHYGAHFFNESWNSTGKSVYGAVYPSKTQWKKHTQQLTVPAGTEIFQYQLYTDTVNADVYIDDIAFTCDGQNVLVNGGLERGNLTGNFAEFENTPQIVQSLVAHSGTYGAYLTGDSAVMASVTELDLNEDARVVFSGWLRGKTGTVSYQITSQGNVLAEGTWNVGAGWNEQTASCYVPAGTEELQLQISNTTADSWAYLDDLNISFKPMEQAVVNFHQIYSDGTWRLTSDDMDMFAETYYKVSAVVDGEEGYVLVHKVSGMLCIYPDFFKVYGGSVPVVSLQIPAGAVWQPVSPNQAWGVIEGVKIKTAQAVEVTLAEAAIKEWNLSLGSDLTVNFYGDIQANDLTSVQVVITVADKTYSFVPTQDMYDLQKELYHFSIQVAAAQMTDDIAVQILYSGVTLWEKTYTVQQYAQYVLSKKDMQQYHSLVIEMLHYGSAAQTYFDYHTERIADAGITDGCTAEVPANPEQEMKVEGLLDGLYFYGATLMFRHKVAIRYYFVISGDVNEYTFTENGVVCKAVKKDGLYYVELSGVNPQDWEKEGVLIVSDQNGNTMTVSYSPMHYMVRKNAGGTDSVKQLLKAMYNYHLAAKQLVAAQPE